MKTTKTMKTTLEYLEYHYQHEPDLRVWRYTPELQWPTWRYWRDIRLQAGPWPNYRTIRRDEVVLDIEAKDYDLTPILKELHAAVWASGGRGIHVHTYFPELSGYTPSRRQFLKEEISKYLGGLSSIPDDKLDLTTCRQVHTIGAELSWHRKGTGLKILLEKSGELFAPNMLRQEWILAALRRIKPAHLRTGWSPKKSEPERS